MENAVSPSESTAPAVASSARRAPLLSVRGLRLEAASGAVLVGGEQQSRGKTLGKADGESPPGGIDLTIDGGEAVGLVGDSGSGKTLTALSVIGLLPPGVSKTGGRIALHGSPPGVSRSRPRSAAMVFQEPRSALNPQLSVGFQLREVLRLLGLRGRRLEQRGLELLEQVAMPDPRSSWRAYPHQLSGGQCQRVMIAMALAGEPELLIADEPTTSLDVSVQAQILELLADLRRGRGLALFMISHDLRLIAALCDRLLVMDGGVLVEQGPVQEVFAKAEAAATRRLLEAVGREL